MTDSLKAASEWYIKIHADHFNEEDQQAFERWKNISVENKDAWRRIQSINESFEELDPSLGKAVLLKREIISSDRRQLLKKLGIIVIASGAGLSAYQEQPWQTMLADYSTGKGESKTLSLPDKTVLVLNTDTSLNTHYTKNARIIVLLKGEVLIETGHGNGSELPFIFQTQQGIVTPFGTRFSVRQHKNFITVNVFSDSVSIKPNQRPENAQILASNQTAKFTDQIVSDIHELPLGSDLWAKGILMVTDMPLKDFLTELGRYYSGFIRCDPSIESIPISGSFPVKDINAIFTSLQNSHPIRMDSITKYWVSFKPA